MANILIEYIFAFLQAAYSYRNVHLVYITCMLLLLRVAVINVFGKRAKPQHREGKGGSKYRELSGNQRFLLLHLLT
jgi:hypothetical protein